MKVGIIGAMDEEVKLLKEEISDKKNHSIAGSEFTEGKLGSVDVILLKSGIGKVNASMGTTLLNHHFQPDVVINTGSAGGFHQDLDVGDAVISEEVCHHDVDVTAFGYDYGQVPGMPPTYKADSTLVEIAEKCADKITDIHVAKGLIATGDSFMSDPERVDFVRKKFENLYAVEMEAAAIAQVCYQFQIPFVIIRALSDIAGKDSNTSFEQFLDKASHHSATLVKNMVHELEKQR